MTYLGYKDDGSFPEFVLHTIANDVYGHDSQYQPTSLQRGKRIFCPTFNTSRYVNSYIRDEMRTIAEYGNPDLILVVGCNPMWPEVTRHLNKFNDVFKDKHDIILRVFKCKIDHIVKDIVDDGFFGLTKAVSWVVAFPAGELPIAYLFVYLQENSKFTSLEDMDTYATAEIPDESNEPELYAIIKEFMIADSCPCNNFPKPFADATSRGLDCTIIYKRRDDGLVVLKEEVIYDNRYVIPYNKSLSLRYHTYLSVEGCGQEFNVLRWIGELLYDRER